MVPSRSYRLDVRPYQINLEEVVKTFKYLKEHHEKYYTLYRLMLEGGLRLVHAIHIVKTFTSNEVVEIPEVGLETRRLVCFYDKGFCRYYMGVRGPQKPCEWPYPSTETLELLQRYAGSRIGKRNATKYAKRHKQNNPSNQKVKHGQPRVTSATRII